MFEKVNPSHPDKVADRIAGAIVDKAYEKAQNPRVAVEILHSGYNCSLVIETSVELEYEDIAGIVRRISPETANINVQIRPQDKHLSDNQTGEIRCGDNGIFRGVPVTDEQKNLTQIARDIYATYGHDGKYILDGEKLIICQSNATTADLKHAYPGAIVNPLGDWTGGATVDTGAVNRKLGSDMGDAITGGGLHGKDLSKADVSVNIYAHLKAQKTGEPVEISCAIGDDKVDGKPYSEIVKIAKEYIDGLGGFEKFAEWGLIR